MDINILLYIHVADMEITIQTLTKADVFSSIFQNIKTFTDSINVLFEKTGIFLQTMDNSRISILEIRIPNTWFDSYIHTANSSISIGLNASILYKILNARDKSQKVKIIYDEGANDTLSVYFEGDTKNVFDKSFEVPLMDLESETMAIPNIEYQAEFSLPSSHFQNLVSQLKMFGETMDIKCSENKIELVSNSQDSGKMSVEIKIDDLTSFAIDEDEELNLSFSLNYLYNICLYNKLTKEIDIKLCNNYPLSIIYNLGDGAEIKFYLAPKISDD